MMISFDEMTRYILMLKEEEMENNYKLTDAQIMLNNKVREGLKNDPELSLKFNQMIQANSLSEMKLIWHGMKKNQAMNKVTSMNYSQQVQTETKVFQNGPQYVKRKDHKRAGYVDALVMALVTGFVGGIFTTIMMMMI